jgi:hypothetical protein
MGRRQMSDPYTSVETTSGGYGLWGFVPVEDAVEEARRYFERQLIEAQTTLALIDSGKVRVFHQRGPCAAEGRRQVFTEPVPVSEQQED